MSKNTNTGTGTITHETIQVIPSNKPDDFFGGNVVGNGDQVLKTVKIISTGSGFVVVPKPVQTAESKLSAIIRTKSNVSTSGPSGIQNEISMAPAFTVKIKPSGVKAKTPSSSSSWPSFFIPMLCGANKKEFAVVPEAVNPKNSEKNMHHSR